MIAFYRRSRLHAKIRQLELVLREQPAPSPPYLKA